MKKKIKKKYITFVNNVILLIKELINKIIKL